MGLFRFEGDPSLALAEECAEVIQVINKMHRFKGEWQEIPQGKSISRWDELCNEMEDLIFQWKRLQMYTLTTKVAMEEFRLMALTANSQPTEDDLPF